MPVLFSKKRHRLPTSSSTAHFPQGQPSSASLHGHGQPNPFHRADSATSKKTFHSATSGGTNTVIVHEPSTGIRSISSSIRPKEIHGIWNKFKAGLKDFYKRRHIKYLLPLIAVLMYMLLGAVIFYWLETDADEQRVLQKKEAYQRERILLIKRMDEIIKDKASENNAKRQAFIEEAVDNFHKEMKVDFGLKTEWNFMTAMYFAGTLFTTIGYGDVACTTSMGRVVTVVYGLIGIPIMLMTLNHMGKFLFKSINEFLDWFSKKTACCTSKFKRKRDDQMSIMEKGEGTSINSKNNHLDKNRKVSFNLRNGSEDGTIDQLSLDLEAGGTQGDPSDDAVFNDEEEIVIQEEFMEAEQSNQTMPVTAALFITIGWIFFCAALFKLWEDWTYAESWYFMFISMSTIGLGDVSVQRRDMMVLCFVFVIIGLSLVSMCINVIQQALEDLYKNMLMKLLMDYQAQLSKDGDHKGASMGMMKMWGHSKTAKYLMPMLSANTRRHVMTQIQEEAKENGVELPPIFEDLDDKTGMPKILAAVADLKSTDEPDKMSVMINDIVRQSDPTRTSVSRSLLPTVVCYEADTQTDSVLLEESSVQTISAESEDSGVQTDMSGEVLLTTQEAQTDIVNFAVEETQTPISEYRENETMTQNPALMSLEVQTERVQTADRLLQTQIVDYLEHEMQTDLLETKNNRSQTEITKYEEASSQTEKVEEPESPSKSRSPSKQAKKRVRKIFKRKSAKRRNSQGDALSKGDEEDNSAGSYESLDWDPVDGLHAERQRAVSDLKRLFDPKKK